MKRIKDIIAVVTALIIIAALTFGVYYGAAHKVICIGNFCYKADTQLKAEYFDIDPDRLNVYALNGTDYNLVIAACSRDTENSDNIGIYSIYFNEVQPLNGKFDHSEDPAYTAWYDERPFGVSSPLFDKDDAA